MYMFIEPKGALMVRLNQPRPPVQANRLDSTSGLVTKIWYRIPFDQSEQSVSIIPPTKPAESSTRSSSLSKLTLDFEEINLTRQADTEFNTQTISR
jgi:hypothetical protein